MTIQEALDLVDQLKPNMMPWPVKIRKLCEVDQLFYEEIVIRHEPFSGAEEGPFLMNERQKIADEVQLEALHEKADVVAFIEMLRADFHQEILFRQARLTDAMMTFMTSIEQILKNAHDGSAGKTKSELISFLEDVDSALAAKVAPAVAKPDYNTDTDPGTALLIPDPYAEDVYIPWLEAAIDKMNQELDKYNNDVALFDRGWRTAADWWNRTRMPLQRSREIRI